MPRLVVPLTQEEFDRLRDRALRELRHPRHTARLLLRGALDLPELTHSHTGRSQPSACAEIAASPVMTLVGGKPTDGCG